MTHPKSIDRRRLLAGLRALAEATPERLTARLTDLYAPDAQWRGSHPINEMQGIDAIADQVWQPLLRSFPDLERRDAIFVGGSFEGRDYIAAVGHYCGTFRQDWLTIPATGAPIYIRYGEVHQVENGRIVQSSCLWDVLDVIRQAGFWPIAPSLGTEGMWPGPLTADGVALDPLDATQGAASLAQTLAMHGTLGAYNDQARQGRDGLLTMPQKEHWHPKMMWYGPSGIGTTRGLQGFVDYHQLPFRTAFPGRKGGGQWDEIAELKAQHKGGHYIRIGDGPYSVTGGWPSVFAMHAGGGFLGVGPTNRPVTMRVMDFYLHHEGLIRENWVPLDILDLLLQMGVDVMDRMQPIFRRGR
ncbi:SnoaL-like domain-containing protein [Loktanella atrilutea]|uniref:SnoaL-like domain-containing protein n=1 Tax=Loktanella atrilutea TaxID=366533 RepID=A0A1M5DC34_LOKAT|nr:ester cyclase [Loktanella atrilutea]SHF64451.1 SnoaL-like domain-containing protein [Loktanella atrilutea]